MAGIRGWQGKDCRSGGSQTENRRGRASGRRPVSGLGHIGHVCRCTTSTLRNVAGRLSSRMAWRLDARRSATRVEVREHGSATLMLTAGVNPKDACRPAFGRHRVPDILKGRPVGLTGHSGPSTSRSRRGRRKIGVRAGSEPSWTGTTFTARPRQSAEHRAPSCHAAAEGGRDRGVSGPAHAKDDRYDPGVPRQRAG